MQDNRIHDRAGRDAKSLGFQVYVEGFQHEPTEIVRPQQMPETAHSALIRELAEWAQQGPRFEPTARVVNGF